MNIIINKEDYETLLQVQEFLEQTYLLTIFILKIFQVHLLMVKY